MRWLPGRLPGVRPPDRRGWPLAPAAGPERSAGSGRCFIAGRVPTCRRLAGRGLRRAFSISYFPYLAVADTYDDFYHQKTDADLQFIADHPELYQPSLIEAARRELRRRGVLAAPASAPAPATSGLVPVQVPVPVAAPAPMQVPTPVAMPAPATSGPAQPAVPAPAALNGGLRLGPLALGLAGMLFLSLGVLYVMKQKEHAAPAVAPAPAPARRKTPPRLEAVETSAMPSYDGVVQQAVQQQLARVPAAEQAPETERRQYRELAKRFWTAECQTEFVLERARQGKMDAFLPGHVVTAMATWEQWNKATLYGYKFGPKMTEYVGAMSSVARQQQEGLADLLIVARNPQPYDTPKTKAREADVNDLLRSLLPKSPVTGRAYPVLVRRVQL